MKGCAVEDISCGDTQKQTSQNKNDSKLKFAVQI